MIAAYDRPGAVRYAHEWAYRRNPAYYDFSALGGDCTNFASQCIYAGSGVMNFTPDTGWYYLSLTRRTPAWTGVEFLYRFLVGNTGAGPYAVEVPMEEALPGDVLQLTDGTRFYHSPVIVSVGWPVRPDTILVAAHTLDADYRPLSTYRYAGVRFVHILGVRRPG
jgi:hypothetical protein